MSTANTLLAFDEVHPDTALGRALTIARLSLALGRVERMTRHEDGARPETDSDHTVMVTLLAYELAPPHLDRGKVAIFGSVHDLHEVYCGDEQTLRISPEAIAAKRAREATSLDRVVAELGYSSRVASILERYEAQREPEARFVRLVDKITPRLTHCFNGCVAAQTLVGREEFVALHRAHFEALRAEYPEFPETLELLRAAMLHAEARWLEAEATARGATPEGNEGR